MSAKRKSDKEMVVIRKASSQGSWEDLPARLMRSYTEMNPSAEQTIVVSANLEGSFCVEIRIPKMPSHEIKNALSFELQRQIPVPLENLIWSYRITEHLPNQHLVRVFAVKEEVWNKALSAILESGIRLDALVHPAFLMDSGESLTMDAINHFSEEAMADFSLEQSSSPVVEKVKESVLGETHFSEDMGGRDFGGLVCRMLACQTMGMRRGGSSMSLFPLPQSLRPVRFRFLKTSFIFLAVANVLLALLLCARHSADSRRRLSELKVEKSRIDAELFKIAQEEARNRDLDEFMKRMSDTDPGDAEIVAALLSLTRNLPSHIWISNFSSRAREIDLSISTNNDKGVQADLSKLNSLPEFSNVSIKNTRRDKDGSLTVYLKLTHNKGK